MYDGQIAFAEGHNRAQWDIHESPFRATKIDPREISATPTDRNEPAKQGPAKLPTTPVIQTSQASNTESDTVAPLVDVHDRRNQLTSLVQNARRNEEAIKARNERIKKSKQQSRNRYGW